MPRGSRGGRYSRRDEYMADETVGEAVSDLAEAVDDAVENKAAETPRAEKLTAVERGERARLKAKRRWRGEG